MDLFLSNYVVAAEGLFDCGTAQILKNMPLTFGLAV